MSVLEAMATLCLAVSLFAAFARFHPQDPNAEPDWSFAVIRSTWWRWSVLSIIADAASVPMLVALALDPGPAPSTLLSIIGPIWVLMLVVSAADATRTARFRKAMGEFAAVEGARPSQVAAYAVTMLWFVVTIPIPIIFRFDHGSAAAFFAFVAFVAYRMVMALSFNRLTKEPSILDADPEIRELVERSGIRLDWIGHAASAQFNAFALPNHKILIMGPRSSLPALETHALVAHELTHLKYGDVALYVRMLLVRSFAGLAVSLPVLIVAGDQLTWGICLIAIALARAANGVVTLAFAKACRNIEFRADREAGTLVDPRAMVDALTRIHLGQGAPHVWPSWLSPFMTHPSLAERRRALLGPTPPSARTE